MFFASSKIAWAVLAPLNFLLLLLLAGAVLHCFCVKAGRFLTAAAVLMMFLIGVTPLGPNLLAGLENRYERPDKLPAELSGILILGGTFDGALSAARGTPAVNGSMERILEGLRLAQERPLAEPVFSGGEGLLLKKAQPEAREAARWLAQAGGGYNDPGRFVFEDKSRNTWENVRFTMAMMNPGPEEIWIVVTSAYHMPRTMAVFEAVGWPGQVIAWPTDYRTDGTMRVLPHRFDVSGNFDDFSTWWHETLGSLAYKIRASAGSRP